MAVFNRLHITGHGIDDHGHVAIFNHVNNVWTAFQYFVHHLHDDAFFFQMGSRTTGGAQAITQFLEIASGFFHIGFVLLTHRQEHFAHARNAFTRTQLRFQVGFREVFTHTHHFAC